MRKDLEVLSKASVKDYAGYTDDELRRDRSAVFVR